MGGVGRGCIAMFAMSTGHLRRLCANPPVIIIQRFQPRLKMFPTAKILIIPFGIQAHGSLQPPPCCQAAKRDVGKNNPVERSNRQRHHHLIPSNPLTDGPPSGLDHQNVGPGGELFGDMCGEVMRQLGKGMNSLFLTEFSQILLISRFPYISSHSDKTSKAHTNLLSAFPK